MKFSRTRIANGVGWLGETGDSKKRLDQETLLLKVSFMSLLHLPPLSRAIFGYTAPVYHHRQ